MCNYLEDEYKIAVDNVRFYTKRADRARNYAQRQEYLWLASIAEEEAARLRDLLFAGDY